jgi:hypothetical protein
VFEKHKAKVAAKEYEKALAAWQAQRDGQAELLQTAESFGGVATAGDLLTKPGEAVFLTVTNCALMGQRRAPGQWQGRSQGLSIPVGSIHGRSVRYRVGTTRGHLVQGAMVPTATDTGTVHITNQRVIFTGLKQTRECLFAKLMGFEHAVEGSTTFSVSNRQQPTTIFYGAAAAPTFDFRLDLAMAHFRGTVPAMVETLKQDLAQDRGGQAAGAGGDLSLTRCRCIPAGDEMPSQLIPGGFGAPDWAPEHPGLTVD